MEINIIKSDDSNKLPINIDAWKLVDNNKVELIHLQISPKETLQAHINPVDVVFYVMDGYGTIKIEQNKVKVLKGDCITVKAGLNREWQNTGNDILSLIVLKVK